MAAVRSTRLGAFVLLVVVGYTLFHQYKNLILTHIVTADLVDLEWDRMNAPVATTPQHKNHSVVRAPTSKSPNTSKIIQRSHPHAGARDEAGNYGYLHDPTYVRTHLPELSESRWKCDEKGGGMMAFQKIRDHLVDHRLESNPRIFCVVYSHAGAHDRIEAIAETWGRKCDGFMVASTQTNRTVGAVDLPHMGKEEYQNMWQKIRSMWAYVYDNYRNDYDYFHACGDDTFVVVENLRSFVVKAQKGQGFSSNLGKKDKGWRKTWNSSPWEDRPLMLGAVAPFRSMLYCQGGPGYTLNRLALDKLLKTYPTCLSKNTDPREDVFVTSCLNNEDVICMDTRDEMGAWRYHMSDAEFQEKWSFDVAAQYQPDELKRRFGIESLEGLDGLSEESVAFHLKSSYSPDRMRRYYSMLYGKCNSSSSISLESPTAVVATTNDDGQPNHPHAGARDENGNWGYVHDTTSLRLHLPELPKSRSSCDIPPGEGSEGNGGLLALQKIQKHIQEQPDDSISKAKAPRILCIVYTHAGAHDRLEAIAETWGRKCDGFLAASTLTNRTIGAVDIPHLGKEEYQNMWQKIRSMWAYVYDNYRDDYDYFHACGDDSFIVVENLRSFVVKAQKGQGLYNEMGRKHRKWLDDWKDTPWEDRPLMLGAITPFKSMLYCHGGPGYTLNRKALDLFLGTFPTCLSDNIDPREDVFVTSCIGSEANVICMDTRDENRAWRYHMADADFQVNWTWKKFAQYQPKRLQDSFGIESTEGIDGLSEESVAFHLKDHASPERIRRYHSILYGTCN